MSEAISISTPAPFAKVAARPPAAKTKRLLEGPVLPTLLRLATPNVLNLLALAGMITFDGLFLGRLGADALAGVSLAFPWVMLIMQATNGGMGAGVSSAIARALGAGRRDRADALVAHAFVLALAGTTRSSVSVRRICSSLVRFTASTVSGWRCSSPRRDSATSTSRWRPMRCASPPARPAP